VSRAAPRALRLAGAGALRLRADAWGDPQAPPVLFLHGGGQTRHAWGRSAAAVARDGWHAVALDLRGHGESDWAPDGDYRLGAFRADLERVLEAWTSPAVLVGASLGGLAILLAAESPRFAPRAVVLVDVAPRLERAGTERIVGFMTGRPEGFASLDEAAELIASFTRERSRARSHAGLAKVLRRGDDGRWRWHWDPRFISARGPAELLDRARLLDAARRIAAPALLVRGRESDVLSHEGAGELLAALPDVEFADVSGAGHMVAGDRNDAFTDAVRGFLRRRARSAGPPQSG
jgi:pimeloyl-ACP methyl ester carboxylesterase